MDRIKRFPQTLLLILVGVFSFTFFLYMSFPYEVLKEAVAVHSSEATGLNMKNPTNRAGCRATAMATDASSPGTLAMSAARLTP